LLVDRGVAGPARAKALTQRRRDHAEAQRRKRELNAETQRAQKRGKEKAEDVLAQRRGGAEKRE
jgi:hypothetical protein